MRSTKTRSQNGTERSVTTLRVEYDVDIYDVVEILYAMSAVDFGGHHYSSDRSMRSRKDVMYVLRTELHRFGERWKLKTSGRYNATRSTECWAIRRSIARDLIGEEAVTPPDWPNSLRDDLMIYAGELFPEIGTRHATPSERKEMSDSVLQAYYDGDPVRRIPKRLTPDKSRVDFQVEWTGRPDWLSEEEAQHCNRIRKP